MFRAGYAITFDDQTTTDIIVGLPEFMGWARKTGHRVEEIDKVGDLEDFVWLCWSAATRSGLTKLGFEDWAATIVDMERFEVDAPKATPKGPSRGLSSRSKSARA